MPGEWNVEAFRQAVSGTILMLSAIRSTMPSTSVAAAQSEPAAEPAPRVITTDASTNTSRADHADDMKQILFSGKDFGHTYSEAFDDRKYRTWYIRRIKSSLSAQLKHLAQYCIRKEGAQ